VAQEARAKSAAPRREQPRVRPAALMARAEEARKNAYAPYSRFHVGAALLTADGTVYEGCNIENSSFGLSICAERNAIWKAISEGVRDFEAVAVTAGPEHGASPCGACRQVLHEFAPNLWVIWYDGRGRLVKKRLGRLLDSAFDFPRRKP
jgi:cytidine deaminase